MKVRTHGDAGAPTVLCLHPLACAGDLWDRFALFLVGRGFRVLAPDLPAEVAQDGLTVAAMAESVVRAVESDCPVSIVALSMGGCVALQLAIDHPELVDKLVLADTTANYGPDRVAKWEQRAEYAVSVPRTDQLDFQIPRWFTADFVARDPDECSRIADIFVRTDSEVHAACCRALGAFDVLTGSTAFAPRRSCSLASKTRRRRPRWRARWRRPSRALNWSRCRRPDTSALSRADMPGMSSASFSRGRSPLGVGRRVIGPLPPQVSAGECDRGDAHDSGQAAGDGRHGRVGPGSHRSSPGVAQR